MIVTFKGLRDMVLRHLDESTDEGTTYALVGDALNAAHQQRCVEFPWRFMLWETAETLTTVGGQSTYVLHPEFGRGWYFWNQTTSEYLREVPLRALPQVEMGLDTTDEGDAKDFFFSGLSPVKAQPAEGAVTLVSSSSSDTGTDNQVVIKGETTDGDLVAEILTPLGTSPVTSGFTFRKILAVTKETEWTGTLTLTDSAGATLLTLYPKEMGRRYPQLTFVRPPTAGQVISYRFYRQPLVMVNDYDQPELPAPFARLLVWDALLELQAYLSNPNPSTIEIWRSKQLELQNALYQAWANEGDSLGSAGTYVRDVISEG